MPLAQAQAACFSSVTVWPRRWNAAARRLVGWWGPGGGSSRRRGRPKPLGLKVSIVPRVARGWVTDGIRDVHRLPVLSVRRLASRDHHVILGSGRTGAWERTEDPCGPPRTAAPPAPGPATSPRPRRPAPRDLLISTFSTAVRPVSRGLRRRTRSQAERTRREYRHLNFYEPRDNLLYRAEQSQTA